MNEHSARRHLRHFQEPGVERLPAVHHRFKGRCNCVTAANSDQYARPARRYLLDSLCSQPRSQQAIRAGGYSATLDVSERSRTELIFRQQVVLGRVLGKTSGIIRCSLGHHYDHMGVPRSWAS